MLSNLKLLLIIIKVRSSSVKIPKTRLVLEKNGKRWLLWCKISVFPNFLNTQVLFFIPLFPFSVPCW